MATAASDFAALKRSYHSLRVERIIDETHDSKSVVFEIPDQLKEIFVYKPGQFLTLEVPYNGTNLKRCYSLASSPDPETEHKVTVKRVVDGRISNWVGNDLKVGDTVKVHPPEGRFVSNQPKAHKLLFGGGSGITPIISIIKSTLETTQVNCTLLYANRDKPSIIFKAELDALLAKYPQRLVIVHRLDNVDGFLTGADVVKLAAGKLDHECFMCGPGPFMNAVEAGLKEAGIPSALVHIERFISPADPKPEGATEEIVQGDVPESFTVELDGDTTEVEYTKGQSLLEAAVAAGLDAPSSCEEGFCGCCAAQLVSGDITMADDEALSDDEKNRGLILTCQSRPTSGKKLSIQYLD